MRKDDTPNQDRRHALECMLWGGSGLLWTVAGGVPRSSLLGTPEAHAQSAQGGFSFVHISDTHLGFNMAPNPDPTVTLQESLERAKSFRPAMMLHTGDVTHLSRPGEFDRAAQIINATGIETHYAPGEHDVVEDDGKDFFQRFPQGARTGGFYSFDQAGVHFICLNNVTNLQAGKMGMIGAQQLHFLEQDLSARSASTPIVVFAHIPLWVVHEPWGWGTEDSAQLLRLLARFGSVTVLNGHIHQTMQKVEGHVAFHTGMSTAFPQPAPGSRPSAGPIRDLPPGELRKLLGVNRVTRVQNQAALAVVSSPLEG
ncbi:metallophosphoesterase family protein [Rhodovarius lipocyclicus]|uniref:metallophosphoesterase family protein n=1 Tax=Rhodovarius lipocyclicus TaxID=268410 RepID=UPI0013586019|nr:metallophosphoesterase [Rhodovarius lipocyclicus]